MDRQLCSQVPGGESCKILDVTLCRYIQGLHHIVFVVRQRQVRHIPCLIVVSQFEGSLEFAEFSLVVETVQGKRQ